MDEFTLLALIILGEAGDQPPLTQIAVGHVVFNRMEICNCSVEEIIETGAFRAIIVARACPETWIGQLYYDPSVLGKTPWGRRALLIARLILSGRIPDPTGSATHFENVSRFGLPYWTKGKKGIEIGDLVFYKLESVKCPKKIRAKREKN